jgi:hypothetical protein
MVAPALCSRASACSRLRRQADQPPSAPERHAPQRCGCPTHRGALWISCSCPMIPEISTKGKPLRVGDTRPRHPATYARHLRVTRSVGTRGRWKNLLICCIFGERQMMKNGRRKASPRSSIVRSRAAPLSLLDFPPRTNAGRHYSACIRPRKLISDWHPSQYLE